MGRTARIKLYEEELNKLDFEEIIKTIESGDTFDLLTVRKHLFKAVLISDENKCDRTPVLGQLFEMLMDDDAVKYIIKEQLIDCYDRIEEMLTKIKSKSPNIKTSLYM